MTEDEVEAVAEELTKAGGVSWYPGRPRGPLLRVVSDRYRIQARLAIAALDRYRAQTAGAAPLDSVEGELPLTSTEMSAVSDEVVQVGSTVVYRPPGEQRAYPCRVTKIQGGRAYLVPHLRTSTGWVLVDNLLSQHQTAGPGGLSMADDEIETVAAELARAGGVFWHVGQERGPLKLVMNRYRDRARLAIGALERVRAAKKVISPDNLEAAQSQQSVKANPKPLGDDDISVGSLVSYRPPGDQRTYPCRVEKLDGNRAYLIPEFPACTGWVDLASLASPAPQKGN
jgi:hypothetical protein